MSIEYEYTSIRFINKLHQNAVSKPYTLLDCAEFSNWGKLGLLVTIICYFLFPIILLVIYFSYFDTKTTSFFVLLLPVLVVNVWLLRKIVDYFLGLYKRNLEAEFKNLPSSRKLLSVIRGMLIFAKERGIDQDEISLFIDENIRSQVNYCKTSVNKVFAKANKIGIKNQ
ncbi:hypothetical protein ROV62_01420 [Pasteurella multocida]|uniref:hypothetical protein n=1 Tax=Pasteurella multocida TaxID=747 RepID=UPI002CE6F8B3|nr:hypothetical protein [Pasteurella multocida]MEB3502611.1 hypothetical protein [Pasteurella multocida]